MNEKQRKGRQFEDMIASHFNAFGYTVDRRVLQADEEYDLLCHRKEIGLDIMIMVECKDHRQRVGSIDINKFTVRAQRLIGSGSITGAMMISRSGFTATSLISELTKSPIGSKIKFLDLNEFLRHIADLDYYLDNVIYDFEHPDEFKHGGRNDQPLIAQYMRDDLFLKYYDIRTRVVESLNQQFDQSIGVILEEVLQSDNDKCLLLGEIGSGKSSVCLRATYWLARAYRNYDGDSLRRVPVYISLSGASRYYDIYDYLHLQMKSLGIHIGNSIELRRIIDSLPISLILDGFDEMLPSNTPAAITEMAARLQPLMGRSLPIVLTCRSHYFYSQFDAEQFFTKIVPEEYRMRICDLLPLDMPTIRRQMERLRPTTWHQDIELVDSLFNLPELVRRPILLRMIIDSLDDLRCVRTLKRIELIEVGPTELYRTYTLKWISSDVSRSQIHPDDRLRFSLELAKYHWINTASAVDINTIFSYLHERRRSHTLDSPNNFEYDISTCSFLVRVGNNKYTFAHKSFIEYFVAVSMMQELVTQQFDVLLKKRIDRAVSLFTRDLIAEDHLNSLIRLMHVKSPAGRITAHHLFRQLLRLNRIVIDDHTKQLLSALLDIEDNYQVGSEIAVTHALLGSLGTQDRYISNLLNEHPKDLEAIVKINIIDYYETTGSLSNALKSRMNDPSYLYARIWYILAFGIIGELADATYLSELSLTNERPFELQAIQYSINSIHSRY